MGISQNEMPFFTLKAKLATRTGHLILRHTHNSSEAWQKAPNCVADPVTRTACPSQFAPQPPCVQPWMGTWQVLGFLGCLGHGPKKTIEQIDCRRKLGDTHDFLPTSHQGFNPTLISYDTSSRDWLSRKNHVKPFHRPEKIGHIPLTSPWYFVTNTQIPIVCHDFPLVTF